jgi:hypothetical protein
MGRRKPKVFTPTKQQEAFVTALLEGKSFNEAADIACCHRSTYRKRWKDDPGFSAYLLQRSRQAGVGRMPRVTKSLFDKAEAGSLGHQRLVLEFMGELKNQPEKPKEQDSPETASDEILSKLRDIKERMSVEHVPGDGAGLPSPLGPEGVSGLPHGRGEGESEVQVGVLGTTEPAST